MHLLVWQQCTRSDIIKSVTLARRGNFGHPLILTATPQCSIRWWPKLPLYWPKWLQFMSI